MSVEELARDALRLVLLLAVPVFFAVISASANASLSSGWDDRALVVGRLEVDECLVRIALLDQDDRA